MTDPEALFTAIRDEVGRVVVGHEDIVEGLTISLLARGHVLLEGVPGVSKTTLANSFARATGLDYRRVQMTPDLLPPDITGTQVYREHTGEFELQRGPVFANILLADEVNRATPKTQSALLEAMQEGQVTIGGRELELPIPFMIVATQNPIEMEGVFELPEAQRDRFLLKLTVGLPDEDDQRALLDRFDTAPNLTPDEVQQVVTRAEILDARSQLADVYVDDKVKSYILRLVNAGHSTPDVEYGPSPRAMLALLNASKARALVRGRDYVTPDDVIGVIRPAFVHRLVLSTDAELSGRSAESVLEDVIAAVDPPGQGDEEEESLAEEFR